MSKRKNPYMDVLGSEDDDEDSSSDNQGDEGSKKPTAPTSGSAKPKPTIDLETLERCGYTSDGQAAKKDEPQEEDASQRAETRAAATAGVEEAALLAMKAVAQAEALRQAKKEEKAERMKQGRLAVSHKEKRKRDLGQQSRGKNFVEEEKRLQRQYGMYSGFD